MKKRFNRAFTITELVIVIAVVAILAAVLIPTFANIINKSNQSADTQNLKSMNSILSAKQTIDGKPNTMQEAVEILLANGYVFEKLIASSDGYDIVWDQENNRLALLSGDEVIYSEGEVSKDKSKLWIVADEQIDTDYSVYLSEKFDADVFNAKAGVDVGNNSNIAVNIDTEATVEFTVRTADGDLNINAPNATVNHYGVVNLVDIQAVAGNSYHEYGTVKKLEVTSGHVEFMANSSVESIYVKDNDCRLTISSDVSNPQDIEIVTAPEVDNVSVSKPEQVPEVVSEMKITTFAELSSAVSSSESVIYVKLYNNIIAESSLTIAEGKTFVMDMNGKEITVSSSFSARLFANYGTLTIKGNGSVDVSNAGANGYGTVNNFGTLTVIDGTYTNLKESNASTFYNRNGGTATFINTTIYGGGGCIATEINTTTTINGGYYLNTTYPAIENRGNMLITAGTFENTSCSSCDSRWGYTVRSGESSSNAYLKIQGEKEDSVKVYGVQGGLAVVGGTADIYNGVYETKACEVHTSGASAFYAGYFTGESFKTATTIYGGTFKSYSKTAVMVGNGNPPSDSGAGEESTVIIKGGTFIGGDATKTAIKVEKENYAIGAAQIFAGSFSSNPEVFVVEGYKLSEENGMFVVKEK